MQNQALLALLCCPQTHQRLFLLDADTLKKINKHIANQSVLKESGEPVKYPLESALIRADQKVIYPILDNIPQLVSEEAIRNIP